MNIKCLSDMNKSWYASAISCLVLWIMSSCKSDLPVDYIDPFICTEGSKWHWRWMMIMAAWLHGTS